MCHTTVTAEPSLCHTLSICRKPAQPASSRSKAVDSMAAHSFQTVRCCGCVSPVSDKPDRFCYYDGYDILFSYLGKPLRNYIDFLQIREYIK